MKPRCTSSDYEDPNNQQPCILLAILLIDLTPLNGSEDAFFPDSSDIFTTAPVPAMLDKTNIRKGNLRHFTPNQGTRSLYAIRRPGQNYDYHRRRTGPGTGNR